MTYRAPVFFVLGTMAVVGCWQKLDSSADDGVTSATVDPKGGLGAPFPISTSTPPIGITADENGDPIDTTTTPCDKLKADAKAIRTTFCGKCHQADGSTMLNDIENEDTFINVTAGEHYSTWKYVVPGDLGKSLIYQRVVVGGDMPPMGTVDSPNPHPTISDMSVLRDWILCMGAPSTDGTGGTTTTGAGGTGGPTGAGGMTGTTGAGGRAASGGTTGAGGMTGTTGAGGAMAAGGATGADGGVSGACTGIQNCANPIAVNNLPFMTTVTAGQACYEVNMPVSAINCTNAVGRQIRVNNNAFTINNGVCAGTVPAARMGGYCVQVNANNIGGGQPPATPLTIQ